MRITEVMFETLEMIDRYQGPFRGPNMQMVNKAIKCGFAERVNKKEARLTPRGRFLVHGTLIDDQMKSKIADLVRGLLHAGRDCMRNRKVDTSTIRFHVNDPYYAEAFGVLRCLGLLGMAPKDMGSSDLTSSWLQELGDQVLVEEHFAGSNECDYCLEHFGKDGAGRVRRTG